MQYTARLVNNNCQSHSEKGDKYIPSNYRVITLTLIPWNVFLKVLLTRMSDQIKDFFNEFQSGFHSSRGTIDVISIVWQLLGKSKEHHMTLSIHFINFKAAFNTVWTLWVMMERVRCTFKNHRHNATPE